MKILTPLLALSASVATLSCSAAPALEPGVTELPYYGSPEFTPRWAESAEALPADFHTIPAFALKNQLGQAVTEATVADKVYVVDFFFSTCRGICLDMTENLRKVQDVFRDDDGVVLISHTVTPDVDTVEVLARYGARHGVRPGKWHLLTGDESYIYRLGREAYFVDEDQGVQREDQFLHSENFVLVDGDRHIRGIYNGLSDTAVTRLVEDIRALRSP